MRAMCAIIHIRQAQPTLLFPFSPRHLLTFWPGFLITAIASCAVLHGRQISDFLGREILSYYLFILGPSME